MDILKALVEEMNRYQETPAQALRFLNASSKLWNNRANADEDEEEDTPDAEDEEEEYEIELHVDGKRLDTEKHGVYKQPHTNILTETFTIYITREPHKQIQQTRMKWNHQGEAVKVNWTSWRVVTMMKRKRMAGVTRAANFLTAISLL